MLSFSRLSWLISSDRGNITPCLHEMKTFFLIACVTFALSNATPVRTKESADISDAFSGLSMDDYMGKYRTDDGDIREHAAMNGVNDIMPDEFRGRLGVSARSQNHMLPDTGAILNALAMNGQVKEQALKVLDHYNTAKSMLYDSPGGYRSVQALLAEFAVIEGELEAAIVGTDEYDSQINEMSSQIPAEWGLKPSDGKLLKKLQNRLDVVRKILERFSDDDEEAESEEDDSIEG